MDTTPLKPLFAASGEFRMKLNLLHAAMGLIALMNVCICLADQKQALTIESAIETTRVMPVVARYAANAASWQKRDVLISPDGARYAVMLVRGNIEKNGVEMELISGTLTSLESAVSYTSVASLFTAGFGPSPLPYNFDYKMVWLRDSKRIAFLAEGKNGKTQVAVTDVTTAQAKFLTDAETDISLFDVAENGDVIYTAAQVPSKEAAAKIIQEGFAVSEIDARGLISGYPNGSGRVTYNYYFKKSDVNFPPSAPSFEGGVTNLISPQLIAFSPDGTRAIVDGSPTPESIPTHWGQYTESHMGQSAREARDPGGGRSWIIQRLYVFDRSRGIARSLFDAPKSLTSNQIVWSPDSKFVALGPAFLPVKNSSAAGLEGNAIVVVNVATGDYEELSKPKQLQPGFHVRAWTASGGIEVQNGSEVVYYCKQKQNWEIGCRKSTVERQQTHADIDVIVEEDLHSPPRLVAIRKSDHSRRIVRDLNPNLSARFALGNVEIIEWSDREGRRWRGRLYYPVQFDAERRYPLVIQLCGSAPESQFSIYGGGGPGFTPGLGPPGVSICAAQILSNRGMAVLQIEDKKGDDAKEIRRSPKEPKAYLDAIESAIHAVAVGRTLIDARRIGLSGFSRSGWYVEYALTHSSVPFAAAVVSDNLTSGYLQASLIGGAGGLTGEFAQNNGANGIGEGLQAWLQNAPAFNAHKIRTPLRMQVESGGLPNVVLHWEMFNILSLLHKPVELYVIPDVERGAHNLQNPRQVLASAAATVDWFDFWLNNHEQGGKDKEDQYSRWRKLSELQNRKPVR